MIKQGDCLELMKEIPDGSVDAIICDPPYCVGVSSNGLKSSFSDFNLMRPFFEQCFNEWQRLLKDGGHAYCCTDWRTYPFLYPIIIKYLGVKNLIVWDYGWLKTGNWYRYAHELIMFAVKGKGKRAFAVTETDVWRIRCVNFTKPKLHPAEKPVELMKKMIANSTAAGDVVLDPFMGSGTTGVACLNTGRKFIGFELDETFFKVAQKRIDEAASARAQELF